MKQTKKLNNHKQKIKYKGIKMKKNVLKLSMIALLGIGFSGCMNNETSLSVPAVKNSQKARTQKIDPKIVSKVASKGHDEFLLVLANKRFATPFECKIAYNVAKNTIGDKLTKQNITDDITVAKSISALMGKTGLNCIKAGRTVEMKKLEDLKKSHKEFYNLVTDVIKHVHTLFKDRDSFIEKNKALELLNPKNVDKLNIAFIKGYNHLTARYFPVGNLVFSNIDFDRLKSDKKYKTELAFLLAHEMIHAYAMHTSEQLTKKAELNVAVEVVLNEAYKQLNPKMQKLLDNSAAILAKGLLTKADYDYDNKVMKERANSMVAKVLKGQKDKLELIGVDLTIPQTTKLVLMDRISAQLGKPLDEAIKDTIKKLTSSNVNKLEVEAGAHPKAQEFEADALALKTIESMKLNPKDVEPLFKEAIEKEKKAKKVLISHPSASERLKRIEELAKDSK